MSITVVHHFRFRKCLYGSAAQSRSYDSRWMVPNRLGSRPGTGCGEAMLIAFTQVSRPEEGACRSRRERSSLPDIGSNRSASRAPVGVERDLPTRHPLSRLLRPVGV